MKKERLIKKLEKLPEGTEVCIFDWRKNLHDSGDDFTSAGIEKDFKVEYYDDNDVNPNFCGLIFDNDDYDENGIKED